jgi:N-formylglutamate deformylase
MNKALWRVTEGNSPVVATAIHDGHEVRDEVDRCLAISDGDRLREEDPFTGVWTDIAEARIVVEVSRFQVDLNRPREMAVYIKPEDSWGLLVWKEEPTLELVARSLREYDHFYETVFNLLSKLEKQFGNIVVLDLHTYNHRREGPDGSPAKAEDNPEVNIGTGTMDRRLWAPVVDRFIHDLSSFDFLGRKLDVRENVKFRGGQFSRWVHHNFPKSGCALAIEVKKFFMDEWAGVLDQSVFSAMHKALGSTVSGIIEELNKMKRKA